MICKTIQVAAPVSDDNPLGYIVINESDLTDDHEPFDAADKAATKKADAADKAAK